MRVLKHDPYARIEYLRESVHLSELTGPGCAWCGGAGRHIRNDERVLYRYGHQDDGLTTRPAFEESLFCSKSCHDSYHS